MFSNVVLISGQGGGGGGGGAWCSSVNDSSLLV